MIELVALQLKSGWRWLAGALLAGLVLGALLAGGRPGGGQDAARPHWSAFHQAATGPAGEDYRRIAEAKLWLGGEGLPAPPEAEVDTGGTGQYALVGVKDDGRREAYLIVDEATFQAVTEGQVLDNGDTIGKVTGRSVEINSAASGELIELQLYPGSRQ